METIKILKTQTDKVSTLCRSITYALIATTWLLFSQSLAITTVPYTFIALVAYLFFDISQYLSMVIIALNSYSKEQKGVKPNYLEKQDKKIDKVSYFFFFLKIITLLAACILLISSIILNKDLLLMKF